jgi:hypothetical protein
MNKIKEKLDNYLEFDSSKLFIDKLVRVFGGAIRDIIADMPINDVDILVGAKSLKMIESILISNGYIYSDYLCGKDLNLIYTNMKVIHEPRTFIKGNKIVQLIRPAIKTDHRFMTYTTYEKGFQELLSNVYLTCCGVSYDGSNLYENTDGGILSCLTKTFQTNLGTMYNHDRIIHRKVKLQDRGWREIYSTSDIRDIKIESFLSEKNIEYTKEYVILN